MLLCSSNKGMLTLSLEISLDLDGSSHIFNNSFNKYLRSTVTMPTNHYAKLGLKQGATDEEIKKAYKRLALVYHPDRNKGNEKKAQEQFIAIKKAHDILLGLEKEEVQYEDQYEPEPSRPQGQRPNKPFSGHCEEPPRERSSRHGRRNTNNSSFDPFGQQEQAKTRGRANTYAQPSNKYGPSSYGAHSQSPDASEGRHDTHGGRSRSRPRTQNRYRQDHEDPSHTRQRTYTQERPSNREYDSRYDYDMPSQNEYGGQHGYRKPSHSQYAEMPSSTADGYYEARGHSKRRPSRSHHRSPSHGRTFYSQSPPQRRGTYSQSPPQARARGKSVSPQYYADDHMSPYDSPPQVHHRGDPFYETDEDFHARHAREHNRMHEEAVRSAERMHAEHMRGW